MPKISACIISFNEEQNIEDCLKSLERVADEIVVVDSFSTDRTVEIASQYTDKIYHEEFTGFIEKKNLAVGKASHEWVLSLDCDERLSPELALPTACIVSDQLRNRDRSSTENNFRNDSSSDYSPAHRS